MTDCLINNLFDKQPPEFGGSSVTPTSTYDVIGRRFSSERPRGSDEPRHPNRELVRRFYRS